MASIGRSGQPDKNKEIVINNDDNGEVQESQPMSEGDNEEIESDMSESIQENKPNEIVEPPPLPPRIKTDLSPVLNKSPLETEVTTKAIENSTNNRTISNETNNLRPSLSPEEREYSELRKRNRQERIKKTAQMLEKMRRKQQEAEAWARRKSLIKYSIGGLILLIGTGVLVYYIKS